MERLSSLRHAYDAAQKKADDRRKEYHAEIKRLYTEGMSLRELAQGLKISHQRVHQIVGLEIPLTCSFCGKRQTEVAKLIASADDGICDSCVRDASRVTGSQESAVGAFSPAGQADSDLHCSFCSKARADVESIAVGVSRCICNECLTLSLEIISD